MRSLRTLSAAVLTVAMSLTACSSGSHDVGGGTPGPTPTAQPTSSAPPTGPLGTPMPGHPTMTKVLVVIEENHSKRSALSGMPHLAALAKQFGYATHYKAVTHPSLPNYLALAGGSTFGVGDDRGPGSHRLGGPSVFDAAIAAGKTAKSYVESMPSPCAQSSTSKYAVKHNPWAYFSDQRSRGNCARFDVPAGSTSDGALASDIDAGQLPNVGLLVPDICNDGHDCSLSTADGWLQPWLAKLMDGPDYRDGKLAIVITFDEDDHSQSNTVLTVVISPDTSAFVSDEDLNHYSLARYLTDIVGAPPLREAAAATSLGGAFNIYSNA